MLGSVSELSMVYDKEILTFLAVRRLGPLRARRRAGSHRAIRPDRQTRAQISAQTVRGDNGPEPVVPCRLVRSNDNIVPLANSNQQRLRGERLDGDEVGRHDLHGVAIERDAEVVVHAGVDEAQAVALALLHGDLAVLAAAVGVLVGAVDEDVAGRRGRAEGLEVLACDGVDLEGLG